MEHEIAIGIAWIIGIGVTVLWVADRLNVPGIILLLGAGILAGPVLDLVDPDVVLGELLFPVVSLGVAVLLFEGGFELRLSQLDKGRTTVIRLVTVGVLITWLVGAAATAVLFDTTIGPSLLVGAILTVSGPTVVLPLLRQARVRDPVGSVLRWEGIVIDPIGAILAVTVLEALLDDNTAPHVAVLMSLVVGFGVGAAAAAAMTVALREHWVPDRLQVPVVLMLVVVASTVASELRPESGLIAATVLGVALANQRWAPVGHVADFTESLGPIVLAALFIVLGARVDLDALADVVGPGLGLVAVLVLVRFLVAFVCTIGVGLSWRERCFIGAMAPRGIVAAAVASLFVLELEEVGRDVPELAPLVLLVIVATVIIYGIAARPVSRWLRVAKAPPRGLALVGAPGWVLDLAEALTAVGLPVLLITADGDEIEAATARGLLVYGGRLEARDLQLTLDGIGIREAVVGSNNDELNELAVERLSDELGRSHVYLLPRSPAHAASAPDAGGDTTSWGRRPFGPEVTQHDIERGVAAGRGVALRSVTDQVSGGVGDGDLPLFRLRGDEPVLIVRDPDSVDLKVGDRVVVLTGDPRDG